MRGRKSPVVFSAVVFTLELYPVRVIHRHEDRLLRFAALLSLVVDLSYTDGSSELGRCLILILVLDHVVLDCACQFFRHLGIGRTVLSKHKLSKSDGSWDLVS